MRIDRLALWLTLALLGVNLATTGRWAHVPGALHGWRWPYLAAGILVVAILALRPRANHSQSLRPLAVATSLAGTLLLIGLFVLVWMPWNVWDLTPFLDDWPPRLQSTADGVRLLYQGTFAGWRWPLLGGYAIGTDLNQSLTLIAALPTTIFGDNIGYHLAHLLLFLALPVFVVLDLKRTESWELTWMSAGFASLSAAGSAWNFLRSGDTNSLAGLVGVAAVLAASQHASARGRFGVSALVGTLALTAYSNVTYVPYAVALLLLEAAYYRDLSRLRRTAVAAILAGIASLPLTYELLRYSQEFVVNNMSWETRPGVDVARAARDTFYALQVHVQPWRWLNDPIGLTSLFFPLVVLAAWRREGRAGFYAWGALLVDGLIRLNISEAGATLGRSWHLLVLLTPVALAGFLVSRVWNRALAAALACVIALSFQITATSVPHVTSVTAFLPSLMERIGAADGQRVLLENNPHRDTDGTPEARSERSLYGTHYEALVPQATGKLLYAGFWDGWQFTRFNGEMLAGGGWQGHMLSDADRAAFVDEMHRWGVTHLFVWSNTAKTRLSAWPEFSLAWEDGAWREYVLTGPLADPRLVTTASGRGDLVSLSMRGGVARLTDVRAGERIVVRTHFHPAWEIAAMGRAVTPIDSGGQLAFAAPADGSYDVALIYPARRWLLICPLIAAAACLLFDRRRPPNQPWR